MIAPAYAQQLVVAPPAWINDPPPFVSHRYALLGETDEVKQQFIKNVNQRRAKKKRDLQLWFLAQYVKSPNQYYERKVAFCVNQFSVEIRALWPEYVWQHIAICRKYMSGAYTHLISHMIRSPALLKYLDNTNNRKNNLNENFSRELLELFTLGEGQYTETDVKELARVFTGATVDQSTYGYRFNSAWHDDTKKNVLGHEGYIQPDDVADLLLSQKAAAVYFVSRLWLYFVSPSTDLDQIQILAQRFRQSHYNIDDVFTEMHSDSMREFHQARVLSPLELAAEMQSHFKMDEKIFYSKKTLDRLKNMGQELLNPPNVGGWPYHMQWLDATRLSARYDYIRWHMSKVSDESIKHLNLARYGLNPEHDAKQRKASLLEKLLAEKAQFSQFSFWR